MKRRKMMLIASFIVCIGAAIVIASVVLHVVAPVVAQGSEALYSALLDNRGLHN